MTPIIFGDKMDRWYGMEEKMMIMKPIIERTAPRPRKSLLRPAVMSPNFSRLLLLLLAVVVLFTAPNNDEKWWVTAVPNNGSGRTT